MGGNDRRQPDQVPMQRSQPAGQRQPRPTWRDGLTAAQLSRALAELRAGYDPELAASWPRAQPPAEPPVEFSREGGRIVGADQARALGRLSSGGWAGLVGLVRRLCARLRGGRGCTIAPAARLSSPRPDRPGSTAIGGEVAESAPAANRWLRWHEFNRGLDDLERRVREIDTVEALKALDFARSQGATDDQVLEVVRAELERRGAPPCPPNELIYFGMPASVRLWCVVMVVLAVAGLLWLAFK